VVAARGADTSRCAPQRSQARSWKWKATVLHSGSTSASAPPTTRLPVRAQPTSRATLKWTMAKLSVLRMQPSYSVGNENQYRLVAGDDELFSCRPSRAPIAERAPGL